MKDYEKLSREHFDEMADNYAATDGLYYTPLPKLACDEAAALLAGEKFCAMLDVGCGSGRLLSVLAAAHPDASLVGLDISPKMRRRDAPASLSSRAGRAVCLSRTGVSEPSRAS